MTLAVFWVANYLQNVSSSILLSSEVALGDDVALDGGSGNKVSTGTKY